MGLSGQGRMFPVSKQQRQRWKLASCRGRYSSRAGVPKTEVLGSDLRPPGKLGLSTLGRWRGGVRPLRSLHAGTSIPGKMVLGSGEANRRPFLQ